MRIAGSMIKRMMRLLAGASAALTSAACATNQPFFHQATQNHAWPPSPAEPRVRYLGEISGPFRQKADTSKIHEVLFGPSASSRLITPQAVAVDSTGTWLAAADPNAHCIHVFNLVTLAYSKIDRAGSEFLSGPNGVAWSSRSFYASDPQRKSIEVYDTAGGFSHTASLHLEPIQRPAGLAYDSERNRLYISDSLSHAIIVYDENNRQTRVMGSPGGGPGQFRSPTHIAVARDGSLVVSDSMNFRIQRFSADGSVINFFGRKGDAAGDIALPKGVATDSKGNIWVVDAQFENVQAFNTDGQLLIALGGEGHAPGEFWIPSGAFIDQQDRLWVADTYNRRIQAFQLYP